MKTYPNIANYTISQDLGTNSIGQAAIDNKTNKLLTLKHQKVIVSYTFKLGQNPKTHDSTQKEAGNHRRNGRTQSRSKQRVTEVKRRFAPELTKLNYQTIQNDQRSNTPNAKKKNKNHNYKDILKKHGYKTMDHAIQDAMQPNHQVNLEVVFEIFKYSMKHRGHFLDETPASNFNVKAIDIDQATKQINQAYYQLDNTQPNIIDKNAFKQLSQKIIQNTTKTTDLKQAFKNKLSDDKSFETNLINALSGNDFAFDKLANLSIKDRQLKKQFKINFSSKDFDENKAEFESLLESDTRIIFETISNLYSNFKMQQILGKNTSISEANIERYNLHQEQLKLFKSLKSVLKDGEYQKLNRIYRQWISHNNLEKAISDYNQLKDPFIETLTKYKTNSTANQLLSAFENDQAFLKIRGAHNMNIPHQLHQIELRKIIETQGAFYPFLKELDPFNHKLYALESVFASKIDYYIGPLTTAKEQMQQDQKVTAWAVRKPGYTGPITPWNWQYVLDVAKTAQAFIEKSIAIDSHYYGEKVLPKSSLNYQLFTVLDELNKIQINHRRLKPELKTKIIEDLFQNRNTVTVKALTNYLKQSKAFNDKEIHITGLSNPTQFNNQLSTYNRFKQIIGDKIDNSKYQNDLETIANYLSVFPTSHVAKNELKRFTWLSETELTALSQLSYNGYSKISNAIVNRIKDQNNKTLLTAMQTSTITLQSWLAQPFVAKQLYAHNANYIKLHHEYLEKLLTQTPTKVQKLVNKALRLIEEIIIANHNQAPAQIVIETTRSSENTNEIPKTQINQLKALYQKLPKEYKQIGTFLTEYTKNVTTLSKKQYLYFRQGGLDFYNNEDINWNQLDNYQIDHIIPQSVVKDDSLNNLVLTKNTTNHQKSSQYAYEFCGASQSANWKKLNQIGLIPNRMLKNLLLTHENLDSYTKLSFINRQLTEVSQAVKLLISILTEKLPNTKIIRLNGKMNHQIREFYDFQKIRTLNNNHHAHDAYFNALIGNYLMEAYPSLQALFIQGQYMYNLNLKDMQTFNFLYGLNPKVNQEKPVQQKYKRLFKHDGTKIYYAKWIKNIVETYDNQGKFHNENASKKSNSASLTPLKQGLSTKQFGGYDSNRNKYGYIVGIIKRDKTGAIKNIEVHVGGMPMAYAPIVAKLSKEQRNQALVNIYIKKTQRKINPEDVFVLVPHISNQTVIESNGVKFRLSSSEYIQAGESLVLSPNSTKALCEDYLKNALKNNQITETELNQLLSDTYDEIVEKIQKYIQLYNGKTIMKRLIENKDAFMKLKAFDTIYQPSKFQMLTSFKKDLEKQMNTNHLKITEATRTLLDEKALKKRYKQNPDDKVKAQLKRELLNSYTELTNLAQQNNVHLNQHYTLAKFQEAKILKNETKNSKLVVLNQLVASTLPNNKAENIPELNITNSFGLIQNRDMKLSNDFSLIYESPAGLNRRIKRFNL